MLAKEINRIREDLDKKLEEFFQKIDKNNLSNFNEQLLFNYKPLEYPRSNYEYLSSLEKFVRRGGKRLRPIIMFLTYGLLKGDYDIYDILLSVGVSIELLHAYLLIHDDIIDNSEKRRNYDTIHMEYYKNFKNRENAQKSGIDVAILMGDLAEELSFLNIHSNVQVPKEIKYDLLKVLNLFSYTTVLGQFLDFSMSLNSPLRKDLILRMYEYKTALYSFILPIYLGGILASMDKTPMFNKLVELGYYLGVAYQIKDDLLGIVGDVNKTGKSNIDDIKEGKNTIIIYFTLSSLSKRDKMSFEKIFRKLEKTEGDIDQIRDVVYRSGAIEKTQKILAQYSHKAMDILSTLKTDDTRGHKYVKIFQELIFYLLKRNE